MILRPGHFYSFWRIDKSKIDEPNYHGDVLSDSWGDSENPQDLLLWDGDICSGDVYPYSDIYPELVAFVNETDFVQFNIDVRESADLKDSEIVDFKITNEEDLIVKLDDISGITDDLKQFLMIDPYSQYFFKIYTETKRKVDTVENIKSTPSFSNKPWEIDDIFLYCLIQKKQETTDTYIDLHIETLSQRHIKDLREKYVFHRFSVNNPVFKLKELNERS